jgi:hypothetical protein
MVRIKIKKMETRSLKMVKRSLKMVKRSMRKLKNKKLMTSLKEWI